MSAKIIKFTHKDELASVIKQLKTTKDREVILEVEEGSKILVNKEAMRLVKKTAEVLGKTLTIQSEAPTEVKVSRTISPRVARSDVKPKFSDIMVKRPRAEAPVIKHKIHRKEVDDSGYAGSRFEMALEEKMPSSKFSKIFILVLVLLVAAVFGLAVLLPQATITVFARSEPISRDFEITVDKAIATANRSTMQIPGIQISKEVSLTKSYPTTGIRATGTKTGGNITIYNQTPNILKLNAATTSLIANGKKYVFVKDVSGLKPNGAPNTGIAIAAAEPGESFNLPANTRFQIVNSALGNANVYAENPQALGGGSTGEETKILSQQDVDNATNDLMSGIVIQAESDLTTANKVKMRLLDSAVKKEVLAKTANKNVGDAVESFSMTMIAKVTGLAFREDDVANVVVSKINEVLSNDKYLLDGPEKQYDAKFKAIDLVNNRGVLDVHFETIAAYKVDETNLPKILAGKNEAEIQEILLSKPEIDTVDVKFWPEFFVHKAPKFNGKIKINSQLSE